MTIYAESSAVLAWLLGEPKSGAVLDVFKAADHVVVSDLTIVECRRAIHRGVATGLLTESDTRHLLETLSTVAIHWIRARINEEILDRVSRPFPVEPIRTLDAIHLATALRTHRALPGLQVLTLDRRIRANAEALGFEVVPAPSELIVG